MLQFSIGAVTAAFLLSAAQVAMADGIEINGRVEMGLAGGTQPDLHETSRTTLLNDLDLQIRMSRTTDSGLTIALEFDLDDLGARAPDSNPRDRAGTPWP